MEVLKMEVLKMEEMQVAPRDVIQGGCFAG